MPARRDFVPLINAVAMEERRGTGLGRGIKSQYFHASIIILNLPPLAINLDTIN